MDLSLDITFTGGGVSGGGKLTRSGSNGATIDQALAAGKAGSLTTRTDANTGVATLSPGHGVQTSDVVDVYWEGGVRYGMTATVATNAVTVDGGAGDDLPTQDTAVVLGVQADALPSVDFEGDDVTLLAISAGARRVHLVFQTSGGVEIHPVEIGVNGCFHYDAESGLTNPLAGETVGRLMASNGSTTAAQLVGAVVLET